MNITDSKACVVVVDGAPCWKPAVTTAVMMAGKPPVPVCAEHARKSLWWFKGTVFVKEETR